MIKAGTGTEKSKSSFPARYSQALRIRRDDVTRFTRMLARACLKERYPEMDFLLFLWGKKKQMERLSDGLSD